MSLAKRLLLLAAGDEELLSLCLAVAMTEVETSARWSKQLIAEIAGGLGPFLELDEVARLAQIDAIRGHLTELKKGADTARDVRDQLAAIRLAPPP